MTETYCAHIVRLLKPSGVSRLRLCFHQCTTPARSATAPDRLPRIGQIAYARPLAV